MAGPPSLPEGIDYKLTGIYRLRHDAIGGAGGRFGFRYGTLGRVGQAAGQQQESQHGQREEAAHPGTSLGMGTGIVPDRQPF